MKPIFIAMICFLIAPHGFGEENNAQIFNSTSRAIPAQRTIVDRDPQQTPEPGQNMPKMPDVAPPPPITGANSPKPKSAETALLALYDTHEVVGISANHGIKDLDDFILDLIRNPEFPNRVSDIAVECGNSLYQPILDRYIAGEDVPLIEVQEVWRNTTQLSSCGSSSFYEELFPLVREVNKKLPPGKKLRVLAGDPPIDWSKVKSREDVQAFMNRDETIASVMEKEVLPKHRKALMIFGLYHLYHEQGGVGIYEKNYPSVTYVIQHHSGFDKGSPSTGKYKEELEKRLVSWPIPSLVTIKGTWLADMDISYFNVPLIRCGPKGPYWGYPPGMPSFSKAADGFLYLGPADLLLYAHEPANVFLDKDYMAELKRRGALAGSGGGGSGIEKANPSLYGDAFHILMAPFSHLVLPPNFCGPSENQP